MAKGRKTGGRVAGVPNKVTAAKIAKIEASGLTPLDYMLSLLRDEGADPLMRFEAAKAAAPYVHPRLSQVEQRSEVTHFVAALPEPVAVVDEWQKRYAPQTVQ